jgi:sugar (pentulose or hexulose) kinase
MDRYSLGLSFSRQKARAVVFNIDKSEVETSVVVPYSLQGHAIHFLDVLEQLFVELLSNKAPLNQVAMIKCSAPENLAVCTNQNFYKNLMNFSAYAKSLSSHFQNSFTQDDILAPSWNNSEIAKSWHANHKSEFLIPDGALLFTLKDFVSTESQVWETTSNIQFLSAFLNSILAGKRSTIDSSCAKISGLQTNENQWNEANCNWVAPTLHNKLDQIKPSHETFSYVSSYFVEKFSLYREARVLPAGGNSAASAKGAGGSVYLDTDDGCSLGAVVSQVPNGNGSFYVNGIIQGQSVCIVKSKYDLLLSQWAKFDIVNDSMKGLYTASALPIPDIASAIKQKISLSSLLFSQLAEIKSNAKPFDQIFVTGEYSDDPIFMQACADLFATSLTVYTNSVCGTAIGNALSAARKIKETNYEDILKQYFNSVTSKKYTPSNEGLNQMLSQLIAYSRQ